MTQEELKISINIGAETAEKSVNSLKGTIEDLGGSVDKLSDKTQRAAAEQAAFAAAAAAAFATLLSAVSKGTQALNNYEAAMRGLESVAGGRGIAEGELQRALDSVTDGFFSATAAASAYKNLLTRGYSLDQATNAIMRLKDAAAFGRQASLSLEDAVVSATEGIKNENSVLVDNAGVTKNVAKMWEEYAKARGLVTANLTQAQKVEAEYIGLMQETQLQVGDLAKASDTLAGSQAEQAAQITKLATAYGSALEPAVKGVTETFTGFLAWVTGVTEVAPDLAAGVTGAAVAFAGLMTVLKAAKAAQEAFNLAALKNPYVAAATAIAATVGVVVKAYTSLKKSQEEASERREAAHESFEALQSEREEVEKLSDEYRSLATKQNLTETESRRLDSIMKTLSTQYGVNIKASEDLETAYKNGTEAVEERIKALDAEAKAAAVVERAYAQKKLAELQDLKDQITNEVLQEQINNQFESIDEAHNPAETFLQGTINQIKELAPELAAEMQRAYDDAMIVYEAFADGLATEDEAVEALANMLTKISQLYEEYGLTLDQAILDQEEYVAAITALANGELAVWDEYVAKMQEREKAAQDASSAVGDGVGEGLQDAANGLNQIDTVLGNVQKELDDTRKKLDWQKELADDRKALKKAVDVLVEGGEVSEEWAKAIADARAQYGALNDIDLQNKLGAEIHYLDQQNRMLDDQLNGMIRNAGILLDQIASGAYGEITLNNEAAMEAIRQVLAELSMAGLSVEDITGEGKKKGGGGSGGKSKAEEAAEEAKRLQEEQYREQLEMIEHKRRMDQITAQEELDLLIMVRNTYAQTAEQIREMDERIYEARKALRQAEEEQLTELHEAVMDALEERYEAQREAEQKRIEESIEQWETWADETTDAIQKQIDALDEKAAAEDREAKAAEKLRAIDKIKQQMIYETDEYNLRQLQKQLEKAEADWANTQADWAREDQKKALQEQMEAVEQQAQTQIEALEKESEAIDAFYDQMTEKARLEMEAQEIMMRESQESIIALLKEYAPDYEATGKSFGEKFFDGFKSVLGDISDWFSTFAAALESPLVSAAQYATQSAKQSANAGASGAATITQHVTFNVPVETPSDTAKKMQQVNEALAAML